jgi:hypothetical protein
MNRVLCERFGRAAKIVHICVLRLRVIVIVYKVTSSSRVVFVLDLPMSPSIDSKYIPTLVLVVSSHSFGTAATPNYLLGLWHRCYGKFSKCL